MHNIDNLEALENKIPHSQLNQSTLAILTLLCNQYTTRTNNSLLCKRKELVQPSFSWLTLIKRRLATSLNEKENVFNDVINQNNFNFTRFKRSLIFTAQLLIQRSQCTDSNQSWLNLYQNSFFFPWSAIYKVNNDFLLDHDKIIGWIQQAYSYWKSENKQISSEKWLDYCVEKDHQEKGNNLVEQNNDIDTEHVTLLLNISCVNLKYVYIDK